METLERGCPGLIGTALEVCASRSGSFEHVPNEWRSAPRLMGGHVAKRPRAPHVWQRRGEGDQAR